MRFKNKEIIPFHMLPFAKNFLSAMTAAQSSRGKKPPITANPYSLPSFHYPIPPRSMPILKSVFERQVELEEYLMKNPLTRGKGLKPIKLVKALLGTPTIYGHLSACQSQVKDNYRFPSSPERGFGNAIKRDRVQHFLGKANLPRSRFIAMPSLPIRVPLTTHQVPLVDLSSLFPLLCIGCYYYWGTLPEFVFEFPTAGISILQQPSSMVPVEGELWLDASASFGEITSATSAKESVSVLPGVEGKTPESMAILLGIVILSVLITGAAISMRAAAG